MFYVKAGNAGSLAFDKNTINKKNLSIEPSDFKTQVLCFFAFFDTLLI